MSRTPLPNGDSINKLRNLVQAPKPEIKINLSTRKKTYSTLDRIEGVVAVTAPVDTAFDDVEIDFVGTARTFVERLTSAAAVSGRAEAFHQFLKLTQPGLQEHYPEGGMLRAGQTYDFPFIFVIPPHLLLRICQHTVKSPMIRDAHLQLPPSFGDKDLDKSQQYADDMAPEMASVRYGIFAKISKTKMQGDEVTKASLASKARRLRVIPATEEHPPLAVGDAESDYVMRREKSVKKSVLKGKLGTLIMEAAQPQSLRLSSSQSASVMATVMLRYDPSDANAPPPKLGSLVSKLKAATFFSSTARKDFPSKHAAMHDLSQGLHTEQIGLSARCMANVEWTKCAPSKPAPERRDSACSTTSVGTGGTPAPSDNYKGKDYYTARLLVPIELPTTKAFVPTFHSCLISRIYQLKLELGVHTAGLAPSMELKIPIQISVEANQWDDMSRNRRESSPDSGADEAEVDADDASDFFSPRTIRAPSEGFVGRSRIGSQAPIESAELPSDAPPGYSPLPPASARSEMHHRTSGFGMPWPDHTYRAV
ncbi:hypothetical protein BAUCODRAFT_64387 [Baudoinia panamericana UAMH 10762]|uniref:Uncharacterized protein n=1 Tax=Baudoinia panamericana (strain UAMH 10762) TaxID=717646 RepID=M2LVM7_BAUPA|nr:uncharacterized protein BAUCODRAFT_64387 [Baudoinia panamericana UAMH 10762]EMC98707.1 hypothetical protein BAUCODRAFT_64387 [Baudoinia panamericana UAMH 10762]